MQISKVALAASCDASTVFNFCVMSFQRFMKIVFDLNTTFIVYGTTGSPSGEEELECKKNASSRRGLKIVFDHRTTVMLYEIPVSRPGKTQLEGKNNARSKGGLEIVFHLRTAVSVIE